MPLHKDASFLLGPYPGSRTAWVRAHGLDPASDDHLHMMPSGVSAIETYLDELADQLMGTGPTPLPDAGVADVGVVLRNFFNKRRIVQPVDLRELGRLGRDFKL